MTTSKTWIIDPAGAPHPGWYRASLVKGGIQVPIALLADPPDVDEDGELLGDVTYTLVVDGEERDWLKHRDLIGEPITPDEYDFMLTVRSHDRRHGTVLADARRPLDPLTCPTPF